MKKTSVIMIRGIAVLMACPVLLLVVRSLTGHYGWTVSQYVDIFADQSYWLHFGNSLFLSFFSLLLSLPAGILVGMLIALSQKKTNRLLFKLYLVALLLPFQVSIMPLFQAFKSVGLYDNPWGIIMLNTFAPMAALLFAVCIQSIPSEQWDAARLDTTSVCILLRYIIIPQILPGIVALAVLLWCENWNMVEQPLILLPDIDKQPLSVFYNDIFSNPSGYAGAVIYAAPVLMMLVIFFIMRKKTGEMIEQKH